MTVVLESVPVETVGMPAPFVVPDEAEAAADVAFFLDPSVDGATEVGHVLRLAARLAMLSEPNEADERALNELTADFIESSITSHIAPTRPHCQGKLQSDDPESTAYHIVFKDRKMAEEMGYREHGESPEDLAAKEKARKERREQLKAEAEAARIGRPCTHHEAELLMLGLEIEAAIGDPTADDESDRVAAQLEARGILDAMREVISLPVGEKRTLRISFPVVTG